MRLLSLAALAGAGATVLVVLYRRRRTVSAKPQVLVASTAVAKVSAVERALGAVVSGRKTESLVSDQPMGVEETLTGAKNRLQNMLAKEPLLAGDGPSPFAYAVAIENWILRAASNTTVENPSEVWLDLAVIYVRDLRTDCQAFTTSVGLQIPSEYIAEWLEDGQEGTVGVIGLGFEKSPRLVLRCIC